MSKDINSLKIALRNLMIEKEELENEISANFEAAQCSQFKTFFFLCYAEVVIRTQETLEKLNLWAVGVLVICPSVLSTFLFVILDSTSISRTWSICLSSMLGFFLLSALYIVLFLSNASEYWYWRDEYRLKQLYVRMIRNSLTEKYDRLISEIESIAANLNNALMEDKKLKEQALREVEETKEKEFINTQLEYSFKSDWRNLRAIEFEEFIYNILSLQGYQLQRTPVTGDQGIDLIASKRGLSVAIQVKGYFNKVSNSAIQQAYAGMTHYNCQHCAVITNSQFTSSAIELAGSTGCLLIGESQFKNFVLGKIDLFEASN